MWRGISEIQARILGEEDRSRKKALSLGGPGHEVNKSVRRTRYQNEDAGGRESIVKRRQIVTKILVRYEELTAGTFFNTSTASCPLCKIQSKISAPMMPPMYC